MIKAVHARSLAIEAGKPNRAPQPTLDIFDGLTMPNVDQDISENIPKRLDTFGLEPQTVEIDPIAKYGGEIFDRTLAASIKYAADNEHNPRIYKQLLGINQTVQLPIFTDETDQSTQLSFAMNTDGYRLVKIEGTTSLQGKVAGFFLTQQPDKSVVVHDANVERSWTSDDPNYTAVIDEAKHYIEMYFEGLGALEKAKNLSDAQRKLGLVAVEPEVEVVTMKRETIKQVVDESGKLVTHSGIVSTWQVALPAEEPAIKRYRDPSDEIIEQLVEKFDTDRNQHHRDINRGSRPYGKVK